MPLDFPRARPLLQSCNLTKLFVEELGWEPARQKLTLHAAETDYGFTAIAEKRGFTVWLCDSPDGGLPDHATRLKLDRKLSETSFEHLIVFVTGDRASQSWMWVRREQGKPLAARTHDALLGSRRTQRFVAGIETRTQKSPLCAQHQGDRQPSPVSNTAGSQHRYRPHRVHHRRHERQR